MQWLKRFLTAVTLAWLTMFIVVVVFHETNNLWPVTSFSMFSRAPSNYVEYRLRARYEDEMRRRIRWDQLGIDFGSWESFVNHLVLEDPITVNHRLARLAALVEENKDGHKLSSLILERYTHRLSDGALRRSTIVARWP